LTASLARVSAILAEICSGEILVVTDSKLGNVIKEKLVSGVCQFIAFFTWISHP
jgi:Mn2+/Fe2+ NRAMP family transporter